MTLRRSYLEDPKVEGFWLEISSPKTCGFLMGTFYRPPNSSKYHDNDFLARLDNSFDNVVSEGTEVLMLGDFNCDFLSKRERKHS